MSTVASTSSPASSSATTTADGTETGATSDGTSVASTDNEGSNSSGDISASSGATDGSSADTSHVQPEDLTSYAVGFHELYIHDECTGNDPGSDVCAHARQHEETFTFGGDPSVTYDVTLRVRGFFEPTNIEGGTTPYPEHPYFRVGGTVTKTDYSQWQIRVSEPAATYFLNHYPSVGHTIYKEDFEAVIAVRGGSPIVVRVEDSNDRQIDNGYVGAADRQQVIEGVTQGVVNGQVLRLDVIGVAER